MTVLMPYLIIIIKIIGYISIIPLIGVSIWIVCDLLFPVNKFIKKDNDTYTMDYDLYSKEEKGIK
jgi:hypothetical protein